MSTAEWLRREGRVEGEIRGRRAVVARLLRLKFGPVPKAASARLSRATRAELDRYAARVLSAAGVSDVFRPKRPGVSRPRASRS